MADELPAHGTPHRNTTLSASLQTPRYDTGCGNRTMGVRPIDDKRESVPSDKCWRPPAGSEGPPGWCPCQRNRCSRPVCGTLPILAVRGLPLNAARSAIHSLSERESWVFHSVHRFGAFLSAWLAAKLDPGSTPSQREGQPEGCGALTPRKAVSMIGRLFGPAPRTGGKLRRYC